MKDALGVPQSSPTPLVPGVIRFGNFEVDPRGGELRRSGIKVKLSGQPFGVLVALLEKPGQVVTREELQEKLWSQDTFVDFAHGLNKAINKVRDALGDDADNPRFIETIPRRGYRFLAPVVTRISGDAAIEILPAEDKQSAPTHLQTGGAKLWRRIGLGTGIAVGVIALVATLNWARSSRAGGEIKSLAVLPLENLSRDPEQEYFSDGMTDELTADLSKIGALRVISRTSAMHYKGTNKTLPEIARELNVDGVIEGSVMRSGNRVRITAQLIQARSDRHLWAETYERDMDDVLRLQAEVAEAIAQQVRVQLTPQQKAQLDSAPRVDPAAYDAFLQGRSYFGWGSNSREGFTKAQAFYQQAIQKDPSLALAYVGLADSYVYQGSQRWILPHEAYAYAHEALRKALELDPSLGEAHSSLGWLSWRYDWNFPVAEREFRYALELSPNYVAGQEQLAWYLAWSGRRDEALAELASIANLDLAYSHRTAVESGIYYHQRDYKALLEASQRFVARNPDDWPGRYFLAVGYDGLGQETDAASEYQKAIELSHGDTDTIAGLAHAYTAMGKRAEAEKILRNLLRQSKKNYVSPYMMATIYAGLGDKDKAFEFLEKGFQEKSPDIPYFLKADLRLDTLRSDRRFQDLLRRVGLSQ